MPNFVVCSADSDEEQLSELLVSLAERTSAPVYFARPYEDGFEISETEFQGECMRIDRIIALSEDKPCLLAVENPCGAQTVIYVVRNGQAVPDDVLTMGAAYRNRGSGTSGGRA